jgi:hypothetical protein
MPLQAGESSRSVWTHSAKFTVDIGLPAFEGGKP